MADGSTGPRFALLEEIVRERLGALFEGYEILETAAFRLTRDADFATDDQEAEDLVEAVRQMLKLRMSGDPVRLEIEAGASEALTTRLAVLLGVEAEEIVPARPWRSEIGTSFDLYSALAARVLETDEFPVILSGHCGASIGALRSTPATSAPSEG